MKTSLLPILFAVATALCWGVYGPLLNKSRHIDTVISPFKPFVMIGIAYLVLAVAGGLIGMKFRGEAFQFFGASTRATWLAFAAGLVGALGALTLTLALTKQFGGVPHVVMPIVFGGAVTVSSLVPVLTSRGAVEAPRMLWVGIAGMVVCAVIIASNMPHAPAKGGHAAGHDSASQPAAESAKSPS
ncbi:MAG: hypothetical protein WD069_09725 [Planctomycetales bacterium]